MREGGREGRREGEKEGGKEVRRETIINCCHTHSPVLKVVMDPDYIEHDA